MTDQKGNPKPDPKKRDTENIPFTYGGNADGDAGRAATIKAYFDAEVLPHVPDAWIDAKKTEVGYEIPFTRHFYKYVPPRPLAEIDADLEKQVAKIMDLLREVEAVKRADTRIGWLTESTNRSAAVVEFEQHLRRRRFAEDADLLADLRDIGSRRHGSETNLTRAEYRSSIGTSSSEPGDLVINTMRACTAVRRCVASCRDR